VALAQRVVSRECSVSFLNCACCGCNVTLRNSDVGNIICSATDMSKRSNQPLRSPNPIKHHITDAIVHDGDVVPAATSAPAATCDALTTDVAGEASSPPRAQAVDPPKTPSSPGTNRAAFMQKFTPSRALCNVDLCRSPPGSKITLTAVVIAVFPATTNPDRRYVQLADESGTVGIELRNLPKLFWALTTAKKFSP
jgi:hypothetical protein